MVAEILLVDVLIEVTVAASRLVTITEDPLGFIVIEVGAATATVAFTAPVAVSMTATVLLVELDTYIRVPSGFTAIPSGAARH